MKLLIIISLLLPIGAVAQACGSGVSKLLVKTDKALYVLVCRDVPKIKMYEISVYNHPDRTLLGRDTLRSDQDIKMALRIITPKPIYKQK